MSHHAVNSKINPPVLGNTEVWGLFSYFHTTPLRCINDNIENEWSSPLMIVPVSATRLTLDKGTSGLSKRFKEMLKRTHGSLLKVRSILVRNNPLSMDKE